MHHEMGTFRLDIEIENPVRPGDRRTLKAVLVDTGAELSWVPGTLLESLGVERNGTWRFRQADGTVLERWTGTVQIHVAGSARETKSCSGSRETRSSWARALSRASTCAWNR